MAACSCAPTPDAEKVRPMVYEGMSVADLREILGEPFAKDSLSTIYMADYGKTVVVEKWSYDKRTVLVINDTIKNPNFKD